ncbi:hypothetical protein ACIQ2D_03785 [Lysinibacillus sp. NPDC097287]|uniref:hypothetical protein n=1 Tax=Lysinibacillus sp. NPDC097287 TaxID=3364144 RepID=UPI00382AA55E
MTNSSIRAFGIAIFLVGALLALADRFDINIGLSSVDPSSNKEITELQQKLDAANKEITSLKEQLPEKSTAKSASEDKGLTDNKAEVKEQTKDSAESADTKTMTLQIYSGVTPYVVAQKLEDGGIIPNSVEMELLLANAKYSRSLQIGAYEVNSSMSIEEIAKLITGKK